MRGVRVAMPARKAKLDVLIVAARYGADGKLMLAKGHEPVGNVWSDHRLFTRKELLDLLQAGGRVVHGAHRPPGHDFSKGGDIGLAGEGESLRIVANGAGPEGDDLGVPLF